jgi:hypothetical protein
MPPELCALLRELFGPEVENVRVVEYSWINALHGWPLAVTRRNRIYLRYGLREFCCDPELVVHEYFHVMRQWNSGELTLWRYVRETLRTGYWNNCFEVQARGFASRRCLDAGLGKHQARAISL